MSAAQILFVRCLTSTVVDRREPGAIFKKAPKRPQGVNLTRRTPENFAFIRGFGGSEGTRTPDPLHAMQVRYQLRHRPVRPVRGNELSLHQPPPAEEIERPSTSGCPDGQLFAARSGATGSAGQSDQSRSRP